MFTYVLISAFAMLFLSIFLKNIMVYIGIFASWFGVIFVINDMSKSQDMSNSAPIQWLAGIMIGFALIMIVKSTQRGTGL